MKKISRIISALLTAVLAFSSVTLGAVEAGAVSKIKENKGSFYLKLNKALYDDDYKHTYKVYAFNVNSEDAIACNKKLYKTMKSFYDRDLSSAESDCSLVFEVKGIAYENGNVLSIKQKVTGPSYWKYKTYNVSKKTGKKVTLSQLIKKYGYTKESFYNTLIKKQVKSVEKKVEISPGLEPYRDEMIAYAKSDESRKGLQFYIDGNGKLCAIAKLNTYAGAGIYQFVFKFNKK